MYMDDIFKHLQRLEDMLKQNTGSYTSTAGTLDTEVAQATSIDQSSISNDLVFIRHQESKAILVSRYRNIE